MSAFTFISQTDVTEFCSFTIVRCFSEHKVELTNRKKQEAGRMKERTHATHVKIHGLVSVCPPQAGVLSKRMERSRWYIHRIWLTLTYP